MTTLRTPQPESAIINGRVVTTSLAVSNYFTKRHERVLDRFFETSNVPLNLLNTILC